MSWIYFAILSQLFFAIVFVFDKILVKKFLNPFYYATAVSLPSIFTLLLIPFVDFKWPPLKIIFWAFIFGASFFIAVFLFFKSLEKKEVSWASPLLFGVMVPIISLPLNYFFLNENLSFSSILGFSLLVLAGFILSWSRGYEFYPILFILFSGFFFAFESSIFKIITNNTNFISSFILSRFGMFFIAIVVLLFKPEILKSIFSNQNNNNFFGVWIFKEILAFTAGFLFFYSIFLSSPTLANATNGISFAILFLFASLFSYKFPRFLEEPLKIWILFKKAVAIILIALGVFVLSISPLNTAGVKKWGVTYSSLYAKQLGFDSRQLFKDILNDLKVKDFRLIAYWTEIEKEEGKYDFNELDFQISALGEKNGQAILAVGLRLPRWPECHIPSWAREFLVSNFQFSKFEQALLKYIEAVVNRYKENQTIWAWQIENEPFLGGFGECPKLDKEFLEKEIILVKSLDSRPVILTDSGELGRWHKAYRRADIFGTTMYRRIWNKYIPGGYFTYPLSPDFFKFKAGLMKQLFGEKEIINIELQGEPWTHKRPWDTPLEEQLKSFDINQFKENIEYAKKVGFEKNYLWGVEWWYWMKNTQNHPEFLEEGKTLF